MNAFFVAATPLLPGVRKLPTAVCFDEEGKELPCGDASNCDSIHCLLIQMKK